MEFHGTIPDVSSSLKGKPGWKGSSETHLMGAGWSKMVGNLHRKLMWKICGEIPQKEFSQLLYLSYTETGIILRVILINLCVSGFDLCNIVHTNMFSKPIF